jgi:hypothetical protein
VIGFGSLIPYWGQQAPPPPAPLGMTLMPVPLGDTLGGLEVAIEVLDTTGATGATVGGVPLDGFFVVNGTFVQGALGPHAAGLVDVVVQYGAVDSLPLEDGFEYWDPTVPIAPTAFLEAGDYAVDGFGVGTWTARVGYSAGPTAACPDDSPAGTPLFVAANTDRLGGPDGGWDNLITRAATNGATIAVVLDVTSMSGAANNIIADRDFYGALIFESATSKATFYYYQGSYKSVQVTVPASGRIVLVVKRDISGTPVLKMTVDGTTWVTGDTVGTMSNLTSGMWLGYHQDLSLYPLDAQFRALVIAKTAWSDVDVAKFYAWAGGRHP